MLSRRALLVAASSGLSAYAAGLYRGDLGMSDPPALPLEALGRAWLASGGSRARALTFIDDVAAKAADAGRTPGQILKDLRSADFSAGNTTVLGGWIVAEAEVLLGAAVALGHAGRA
jgi:hypothetical protein